MFISVHFGYNQQKIFNTNCQVAPLLDAINQGCYKEMVKTIKKREEFFVKEIAQFKKKEQGLLKKLEKLEPPVEKTAPPVVQVQNSKTSKGAKGAKKTKKQLEEEEALRKQQEEEERKRKEEEEAEAARKKAEEEEAAKKKKEDDKKGGKGAKDKGKGKGGKDEEVVEEQVVETEEQRIEREKKETNEQIEELRKTIKQFEAKVKLCQENATKVENEEKLPKQIELNEKSGDRKYLKKQEGEYANKILGERKAYVLCQVKKNENDEEITENIVVDGACIRTPEEDIKWEEEQKEIEANPKKGGKPPAKKK